MVLEGLIHSPCSIDSEPECEAENDSQREHRVENTEWTVTERGRLDTVPGDGLESTHVSNKALLFTVPPDTLSPSVDWLIQSKHPQRRAHMCVFLI